MPRTIITAKDVNGMQFDNKMGDNQHVTNNQVDNYIQRLLKYIPSEIVALYLAVIPFLKDTNKQTEYYIAGALTVVTLLYLRLMQKVKKPGQLILSCLCFILWVFALGGPFKYYDWYTQTPYLPALALGVATLFIPSIPPDGGKPQE